VKVRDIMTQAAVCCRPDSNLGIAVELLWIHNYGMLPVVDKNKKLTGVVTDRDICIALGTRNRLAGNLTVGEVATARVFTCKGDDDIHEALGTMADHQVRRLPVVDKTASRKECCQWMTFSYMRTKTSGKGVANYLPKKSFEA
jgi:CBS domain-containing protein